MMRVLKTICTGKKIGAIAAMLAVCMCLSVIGGAIAETTPTPTPTLTPNPTPTAGTQPLPGGDGDTKPDDSDGNSGTDKPVVTAPPKRDTPENDDNTPIEVEVDPDLDADLKPKKGKMKEYAKTAVWTISIKKATTSLTHQAFRGVYTLDFQAAKQGDQNKMYGSYSGDGFMLQDVDTSLLKEVSQGHLLQMDLAVQGPLTNIQFNLVVPHAPSGNDDELAPLEEKLAPLAPSVQKGPLFTGEAKSTMIWTENMIENYANMIGNAGETAYEGPMQNVQGAWECEYYIYCYPNGRAELDILVDISSSPLKFWGTISKKINWKQVK